MMGVFVPFDEKPRRVPIGWVIQENGCWDWVGAQNNSIGECGTSYGLISGYGSSRCAHRIVFERLRGPIPAGLTLDHLCRRRCCVNPDHMEPVTMRVNILRGKGWGARNAARTRCPRGHAYDLTTTWRKNGGRACRTCQNAANGAYQKRKRATKPRSRHLRQSEKREVRDLKAYGFNAAWIGREYGVSRRTIWNHLGAA